MNTCEICGSSFEDDTSLFIHKQLDHFVDYQVSFEDVDTTFLDVLLKSEPDKQLQVKLLGEALQRSAVRHFKIDNVKLELETFLHTVKKLITKTLREELNRLHFVKFGLVLDTIFTNVENEMSPRGFITKNKSIMKASDIETIVEDCLDELMTKIQEHEGRGSGWSLLSIEGLDIRVHKHGYGDRGSSYIPLPEKISNTKSCINVKNEDNECFRYAMLCKYVKQNPTLPSRHYKNVENRYNFRGMTYPVSVGMISKFEKNNPTSSVNVFALDESNNVYPLRITNNERADHTDLLLITKGEISHYVYIKKFETLVYRQMSKMKVSKTVCKRCFCYVNKRFGKGGSDWLLEHHRLCSGQSPVKIKLPYPNRAFIKFDKTVHQYRIPIAIYADFESTLLPVDLPDGDVTRRTRYQLHQPNSFCLLVKSTLKEEQLNRYGLTSKPLIYRGEDAAKVFVDNLYNIANNVQQLYSYVVPMKKMTDLEELCYQLDDVCYLCNNTFTQDNIKVRDHDHLTGIYRGAACNSCNINYKLPSFIPVILHNLSGYDSHFIIPELGRDDGAIDVLATTTEKFISFSKKVDKIKLRFLDSYRFMPSSLLKLSENLKREELVETIKIVPTGKMELVLRKGVFPYDYIDGVQKFEETSLPPPERFYNRLNETEITVEDYQHACRVWNELDIKTLGEYSDFYVKLDVTLLCDVMEEFRNTCITAYGLDPLHSYTSPGLAWQAMLKETKCNLQLLTDIDMLLMVESGVRGGLTQSVTRHVKANNKYMSNFDSEKESIYLGYFDANNLYGWAMCNPLPFADFKWVDPESIASISDLPKYGTTGYILDCDFEYPENLHDHHYDFPLLAKSEVPPNGKHPKLMMTLCNKDRYVAHYWVVQQAIELGLRITKVHRVLQFTQSCWLKPYIESNTKRRAAATSTFQKDFFKLMNNAIFGKTLENKRKHKNVKLVTNAKKLEKLVRKPNFQTSIIINKNLVAVSMNKTSVIMNRPIYVGMSILDISKTHMYDFHYNKMVKFYGRENIGICYKDTDALFYFIKTLDMYHDLKTFPYNNDFDFSDYPKDHPNYDNDRNKKVLGKFKDETNGIPPEEIVALMSKLYSVKLHKEDEVIKKAKGVKNLYVKKNIQFEHYKKCLYEDVVYTATFNTIRSFNHKLYSVTEVKKSLSANDNKRHILPDKIRTLPFGHYSLNPIHD